MKVMALRILPPGVVPLTELVPVPDGVPVVSVPDGVPDVTVVPSSTTNGIVNCVSHSKYAISRSIIFKQE